MLTLFYAGALGLLGLYLAVRSSMTRGATKTMLGTGESFEMLQITRAHGNLVEYALFFLVLSALLETIGQVHPLAIGILGDLFILARLAHAYGITRPDSISNFRIAGSAVTWLVLIIQSLWAIWISINWLAVNNWGF